MVTIEDKIESFKKIIKEDIKEKSEIEIQEVLEETEKLIQALKAKKYEEIEILKKSYATKLEAKTDSIHSKTLKAGQELFLSANKSIYDEFFKDLREKLKSEYMGVMGEKYVRSHAERVKSEIKENTVIYVFKSTCERDKFIIQEVLGDVEVQISPNIKIGGFEMENREKTYRLNFSLDFLLDRKYTDILASLKEALEIRA